MTIVTDSEMGGDARIKGTRIAVYHIVQYSEAGFTRNEIADEFEIEREEVDEALNYAKEHDIDDHDIEPATSGRDDWEGTLETDAGDTLFGDFDR